MTKQRRNVDLERFLRAFPSCPVCSRQNEQEYLRKFFFSTSPENEALRDMLLEAMPDITDIAIASGDQVKVGIPCCRCYEKIFSTGAAGTARECPPDMRLKLVVVGDDTTDKLRIIQEHARPDFTYNYKLTLGMSLLELVGRGVGLVLSGFVLTILNYNYQLTILLMMSAGMVGAFIWTLALKWVDADHARITRILDERADKLKNHGDTT